MGKSKKIKKFILKGLLFILPFIVWFIIELFILPIDFFTFRVWETLLVKEVKVLPGPFYPEKSIRKIEEGELAPHTEYAVKKDVIWHTDNIGYRNKINYKDSGIVIIGDSNITGVNLTQDSILSEVLGRSLYKQVYSFAPAHINRYLSTEIFKEYPPKIVIFSSIERMIISLPFIAEDDLNSKLRGKIGPFIISNAFLTELIVSLDRIIKWPAYNFLRASIFRSDKKLPYHNGNQFFIKGDSINDVSKERFDRAVTVIESYKNHIEAQGSRFIFLPIPDKENIYYDLLPSKTKPDFLPKLTQVLKEKNIEVVDIQPAFEKSYENGDFVFFTDDGHWNPHGVKLAADLLEKQIRNHRYTSLK